MTEVLLFRPWNPTNVPQSHDGNDRYLVSLGRSIRLFYPAFKVIRESVNERVLPVYIIFNKRLFRN
jgi:hypothetical protein